MLSLAFAILQATYQPPVFPQRGEDPVLCRWVQVLDLERCEVAKE